MKAILCAIVLMASFSIASAEVPSKPWLSAYYYQNNSPRSYDPSRKLSIGDKLMWSCGMFEVSGATAYTFMRNGVEFLSHDTYYYDQYNVVAEDIGADITCSITNADGASEPSDPLVLTVNLCTDDRSTADRTGQYCGNTVYLNSPLRCGTSDKSDFTAANQCCICGGGTQAAGVQQPTVTVVDNGYSEFSLTVGDLIQDMQVVCQVTKNDGDCCEGSGEYWDITVANSGTTTKHKLTDQVNGLKSIVTCTMPTGVATSVEISSRYRCEDTDVANGATDNFGDTCADYTLASRYAGGANNDCARDANDANFEFSKHCCICGGGNMLDPLCVNDELNPVSNSGDTQCECGGAICGADKYCYDGACEDKPKVYNNRPTLTVPSGPVANDSTQTLTCTADSDPVPTSVKWYHEGTEITVTGSLTYDVTADSTTHGKPYSCATVNTLGTSVQSERRSLVVDGQPDFNNAPTLTTTADVTQLKVGDVIDLTCKSDANPAANSFAIVMDGANAVTGSTETLQLTITKEHNGKDLTCTSASATLATPVASINSLTLNVHYNDNPTLTSDPATPWMMGDRIKLICTADANPTPTYSFWKDGVLVPGKTGMTSNEISMFIDWNVWRDSTLDYVCKTDNSVGEATSNGVTVQVIDKPSVTDDGPNYPVVGTEVTFTCEQSSYTEAMGYTLTEVKFIKTTDYTTETILQEGTTSRTLGPVAREAGDNVSTIKCVETYSNGIVLTSSTNSLNVGCGDSHRLVPIGNEYGDYGCYCQGYRQCEPEKYCVDSVCQDTAGDPTTTVTPTTNAETETPATDAPATEDPATDAPETTVTEPATETPATDAPATETTEETTTVTYVWSTSEAGTCATTAGTGACQKAITVTCSQDDNGTLTTVADSFCEDDVNGAGEKPASTADCEASECSNANTETTSEPDDSSLSLFCILSLFSMLLTL